eukprot:TRINITY_DN2413_c0_g3_i1.p1 TRINITY_DN2413_c0_g3~~TRINITY_DN2413_c0_g3_i1.p1  ORF type:complete len:238 (+),score=37.56 TRINITY_DN2413_c0_g3_i1:130-843(+)
MADAVTPRAGGKPMSQLGNYSSTGMLATMGLGMGPSNASRTIRNTRTAPAWDNNARYPIKMAVNLPRMEWGRTKVLYADSAAGDAACGLSASRLDLGATASTASGGFAGGSSLGSLRSPTASAFGGTASMMSRSTPGSALAGSPDDGAARDLLPGRGGRRIDFYHASLWWPAPAQPPAIQRCATAPSLPGSVGASCSASMLLNKRSVPTTPGDTPSLSSGSSWNRRSRGSGGWTAGL